MGIVKDKLQQIFPSDAVKIPVSLGPVLQQHMTFQIFPGILRIG